MRAPYNVLVLPHCSRENEDFYCIFQRRDMLKWQFVAGGGENQEKPFEAAIRELSEETGIQNCKVEEMTSKTFVPVFHFSEESRAAWGGSVIVIPVYCFSAEIDPTENIVLSEEHTQYRWVDYKTAVDMLHFDIDKTAIWELNTKLKKKIDENYF